MDHYGNLGHFYPSGYFVSSDNFGNLCHFVHFWPSKTKLDFGSHSKFYPFLSLGKWIIKEGRIVPTTFWSSLISKKLCYFFTQLGINYFHIDDGCIMKCVSKLFMVSNSSTMPKALDIFLNCEIPLRGFLETTKMRDYLCNPFSASES